VADQIIRGNEKQRFVRFSEKNTISFFFFTEGLLDF